MKKSLFSSLVIVVLLLLFGCETPIGGSDDPIIPTSDIPSQILEFISTDYEGYQIRSVDQEDICDDQLLYEVELEDGPGPDIDLYFNQDWLLLFTGEKISSSQLPAEVTSVVDSFSGYSLEGDESERLSYTDGTIRYKVKLFQGENDLELIINMDGVIFCRDDDNSDDSNDDNDDSSDDDDNSNDDDDDSSDDDDNSNDDDDDSNDDDDDSNDDDDNSNDDGSGMSAGQMPDRVKTFIQENYAGYRIENFEREDLCNDNNFYEVELEDGPGDDIELYFSLDWEFKFELIEISESNLPSTVTNAINSDYPNHEIEQDDIYQLNWVDGSIQYFVELDGETDAEIIYNADGSIACIED